jgi:hypothetical protein
VEDKEYKHFMEAKAFDDREWHLALEIPTLRTTHADRGRESTPAKKHQGEV